MSESSELLKHSVCVCASNNFLSGFFLLFVFISFVMSERVIQCWSCVNVCYQVKWMSVCVYNMWTDERRRRRKKRIVVSSSSFLTLVARQQSNRAHIIYWIELNLYIFILLSPHTRVSGKRKIWRARKNNLVFLFFFRRREFFFSIFFFVSFLLFRLFFFFVILSVFCVSLSFVRT